MFWLFRLAIFVVLGALVTLDSQAFVRTLSQSGRPLYWSSPNVAIRANPSNTSGLASDQVNTLFGGAFSSWQVPDSNMSFAYAQSTGYPATGAQDGINNVYFSSRSGRPFDWGVIAVTEVLYYISSGQIAEADISFNDQQFLFTANEGDTGKIIGGKTAIYLRDVATHEVGHVIGLDHSTVNLSSLIYTAFTGQFTLSHDDLNAARTLYPNGGARGSLNGSVLGTRGGIFGAHLQAINLSTGQVEAGALSNPDGSFRIGDLPPGKYAVMMEPFGVDISSISSYYQNVNHRFCSNSKFRRRFYSSCGSAGGASVLQVSAGASASLGTLSPSCNSMGNPGGAPSTIATASAIPSEGGAKFGTLHPGETHYYILHNVSGQLTARAMSYTLFSPIDVRVQFLALDGSPLSGATSVDNVQNPMPGGKVNYDASASATVTAGDYLVAVTAGAQRIGATNFSAGYELLDADGHYLLALAVNGEIAETGATDMSSCISVRNTAQNATYTNYNSSPDEETRSGCGTLQPSGGNPFSGGMMQVLLTALGAQAFFWARRRRFVPALVRKRR